MSDFLIRADHSLITTHESSEHCKLRFTCPTLYTFVATMSLPCMQRKQFMQQKEQCLSGVDLSRKGSVDAPILDLVNFINAQPDFFTTSSCSGRTIVVDNVSLPNVSCAADYCSLPVTTQTHREAGTHT